ncbi:MAG: DUF1801 domain-containing protein [Thermoplasmatales archaeon]|nr:MAG: DUF1801 domain-containing protein [Thermoplasmatales archaeon]
MDRQVIEYIEKQKSPQKKIIKKVRNIFLKTLPNCKEKKAWGVITFADGKFYIGAIKNRVHVGFAINGLSKEEIGLFEGGGKTMRHIKIHSLEDIDEKKLVKLIKIVEKKTICKPC